MKKPTHPHRRTIFPNPGHGNVYQLVPINQVYNSNELSIFINGLTDSNSYKITSELRMDASTVPVEIRNKVCASVLMAFKNIEIAYLEKTGASQYRFPAIRAYNTSAGKLAISVDTLAKHPQVGVLATQAFINYVMSYSRKAKTLLNSLITQDLTINVSLLNSITFYRQHQSEGLSLELAANEELLFIHASWFKKGLLDSLSGTILDSNIFYGSNNLQQVLELLSSIYEQTEGAINWGNLKHTEATAVDGGTFVTGSAFNVLDTFPGKVSPTSVAVQIMPSCSTPELKVQHSTFAILNQPYMVTNAYTRNQCAYDSRLTTYVCDVTPQSKSYLMLEYMQTSDKRETKDSNRRRRARNRTDKPETSNNNQGSSDKPQSNDSDHEEQPISSEHINKIDSISQNLENVVSNLISKLNSLADLIDGQVRPVPS